MITEVVAPFADPTVPMTTLRRPFTSAAEADDPNVVKVVIDRQGYALYFSRAPHPVWPPAADHFAAGVHLEAHRTLRLPARLPAAPRHAGAHAARAGRVARAVARLEHGHPHPRGRDVARFPRRRHAGRPRTRPRDWLHGLHPTRASHDHLTCSRQVHLRHRRRRLVARQGPGVGLDRRAARSARLPGHAAEVRPVHQRRSRAR